MQLSLDNKEITKSIIIGNNAIYREKQIVSIQQNIGHERMKHGNALIGFIVSCCCVGNGQDLSIQFKILSNNSQPFVNKLGLIEFKVFLIMYDS